MRRLPIYFAAWTLIGLLSLGPRLFGGHGPPLTYATVAYELESVWLWAAFTPAMLWLAARFQVTRGAVARRLAIHLGLALAFNVLDVVCDALILPLLGVHLRTTLVDGFGDQLFINVFSYVATVACGHALLFAAQSQARRLRETELTAELARAQLRALEMQLRPHFLFNALNSVSSLVRARRNQEAVKMIAELGDLLRAILHADGEHEATVHEEVELAMRYLRIEEWRFGDRLEAQVTVAPEARAARVPRLVLQPLVENAVRHGVETAEGRTRIELGAEVDGDMLWLSVRDGGGGGARPPGFGIGLANTRARLERLYGDQQKLELSPAEGGGVLARVGVPYHVAPMEVA